jgi:hypothetical protein
MILKTAKRPVGSIRCELFPKAAYKSLEAILPELARAKTGYNSGPNELRINDLAVFTYGGIRACCEIMTVRSDSTSVCTAENAC